MLPSRPGLWLLESEVGDSQQKGMQTLFLVVDNGIANSKPWSVSVIFLNVQRFSITLAVYIFLIYGRL